MKVLIVDCYDSFTFNLYQQVGKLGAEPLVMPCDTPLDVLKKTGCDRIILSPGPGTPQDSGVCLDVLETLSRKVPTLGVCLGHQTICTAFGGEVIRAPHLMHGKTSTIQHDGTGIFDGVPTPFTATRYHSLVAREGSLPKDLQVTATSTDDGYIMGVRHRNLPIEGVQFHPESILSAEGDRIIRNFLTDGVGS
ncbi:MAG: aminodeoxychorismate/anthranilate synthase component II [Methanoregula sp.]|uniref:anthranilate synthase component II n=1 Tax=Methanoregula sp. TaxID=2052170 RepID=UPI0025EE0EFF|nr:aminodeoxychorismate/anthranilate synthase component II [Methanoregula sp.]MCK9631172.1 aminodeoxychorismate/anthranilate synthase component II [Methanoregula sp.]